MEEDEVGAEDPYAAGAESEGDEEDGEEDDDMEHAGGDDMDEDLDDLDGLESE